MTKRIISKKELGIKTLLDLIACELCSVSVALIIDCLVFFGYFSSPATPIVFISILALLSVSSLVLRGLYIKKIGFESMSLIEKDRMRFTKNTLSSTLCYIAILFNVLYFANLYSTDVGNYFYNIKIGMSVVYNLLFLLFTFLCSEGVKNYSKGYSAFLIGIGAMQVVRIFDIPMKAYNAIISINKVETPVIGDKQFTTIVVFLVISAVCCVIAGIVGLLRTTTLENYKKETGLN